MKANNITLTLLSIILFSLDGNAQPNDRKVIIYDQTAIGKKIEDQISFSCKETRQNFDHFEETRSDTSTTYLKSEHDTVRLPTSLVKTKDDENPVIEKKKIYLSDLKGEWAIDCGNGLTTFSIGKQENIISLYGNSIYINIHVEQLSDNEYALKFRQIATQKEWVEDSLKITESEISKDKIIGIFFIKKDGNIELHWIGLYNLRKQKLDYSGQNFLLISENGGKNPVLLKKCS